MQLVRTNAILPFAALADADLTGKEGHVVKADSASGRVTLVTAANDMPFAVILKGAKAPEKNSLAICFGGVAGTVRVKLGADVLFGALIKMRADAMVDTFLGAPGTVQLGVALETGVAGEFIEAALCTPFLV